MRGTKTLSRNEDRWHAISPNPPIPIPTLPTPLPDPFPQRINYYFPYHLRHNLNVPLNLTLLCYLQGANKSNRDNTRHAHRCAWYKHARSNNNSEIHAMHIDVLATRMQGAKKLSRDEDRWHAITPNPPIPVPTLASLSPRPPPPDPVPQKRNYYFP